MGLALSALALGLALLPLETPPFTRTLVLTYSQVPDGQATELAEATRRFVVSGDPQAGAVLAGLMPPDAVSHLADVQRVLEAAMWATVLLAVIVALWVWWSARQGDLKAVSEALAVGAGGIGVLVGLSAVIAVTDFDRFFAAFHSLFFAAGTWTFPSDSLLIRLFPEQFWVTAGLSWALLVAVLAVAYATLSWWLRRPSKGQA